MRRNTGEGRGTAADAIGACPATGVPTVLSETVRTIAEGISPVTDAERVTGRLPAFQDPRISGEITTLVNPEPPLVFRADVDRWGAGLPTYRPAARLYWRRAHGPAAESGAEDATRGAAAGPVASAPDPTAVTRDTEATPGQKPQRRSRRRLGARGGPAKEPVESGTASRPRRSQGYDTRALAIPLRTAAPAEPIAGQQSGRTGHDPHRAPAAESGSAPAARDSTDATAVSGAARSDSAPERGKPLSHRLTSWVKRAVATSAGRRPAPDESVGTALPGDDPDRELPQERALETRQPSRTSPHNTASTPQTGSARPGTDSNPTLDQRHADAPAGRQRSHTSSADRADAVAGGAPRAATDRAVPGQVRQPGRPLSARRGNTETSGEAEPATRGTAPTGGRAAEKPTVEPATVPEAVDETTDAPARTGVGNGSAGPGIIDTPVTDVAPPTTDSSSTRPTAEPVTSPQAPSVDTPSVPDAHHAGRGTTAPHRNTAALYFDGPEVPPTRHLSLAEPNGPAGQPGAPAEDVVEPRGTTHTTRTDRTASHHALASMSSAADHTPEPPAPEAGTAAPAGLLTAETPSQGPAEHTGTSPASADARTPGDSRLRSPATPAAERLPLVGPHDGTGTAGPAARNAAADTPPADTAPTSADPAHGTDRAVGANMTRTATFPDQGPAPVHQPPAATGGEAPRKATAPARPTEPLRSHDPQKPSGAEYLPLTRRRPGADTAVTSATAPTAAPAEDTGPTPEFTDRTATAPDRSVALVRNDSTSTVVGRETCEEDTTPRHVQAPKSDTENRPGTGGGPAPAGIVPTGLEHTESEPVETCPDGTAASRIPAAPDDRTPSAVRPALAGIDGDTPKEEATRPPSTAGLPHLGDPRTPATGHLPLTERGDGAGTAAHSAPAAGVPGPAPAALGDNTEGAHTGGAATTPSRAPAPEWDTDSSRIPTTRPAALLSHEAPRPSGTGRLPLAPRRTGTAPSAHVAGTPDATSADATPGIRRAQPGSEGGRTTEDPGSAPPAHAGDAAPARGRIRSPERHTPAFTDGAAPRKAVAPARPDAPLDIDETARPDRLHPSLPSSGASDADRSFGDFPSPSPTAYARPAGAAVSVTTGTGREAGASASSSTAQDTGRTAPAPGELPPPVPGKGPRTAQEPPAPQAVGAHGRRRGATRPAAAPEAADTEVPPRMRDLPLAQRHSGVRGAAPARADDTRPHVSPPEAAAGPATRLRPALAPLARDDGAGNLGASRGATAPRETIRQTVSPHLDAPAPPATWILPVRSGGGGRSRKPSGRSIVGAPVAERGTSGTGSVPGAGVGHGPPRRPRTSGGRAAVRALGTVGGGSAGHGNPGARAAPDGARAPTTPEPGPRHPGPGPAPVRAVVQARRVARLTMPEAIPCAWVLVPFAPPRHSPAVADVSDAAGAHYDGVGGCPVFRRIGSRLPESRADVSTSAPALPSPEDASSAATHWGIPPGVLDQEAQV